ncbi:class I mannose-6-phosphate isomerase, partial [Deinococcus sp.]|uniref:class I mannose-6-phosphate isomerase n=1 Tax=Deinococcus sp. TaxID=47478 RepID=UPI0025D88AB7
MLPHNYDKFPEISFRDTGAAWRGWETLTAHLRAAIQAGRSQHPHFVVAVECYPGLHDGEITSALKHGLQADHWLATRDIFRSEPEIEALVAPYLGGDDPVFGFLSPLVVEDFIDPEKLAALRRRVNSLSGSVVIYGTGAALCAAPDLLVYADMPRWEGQLRQRRGEVDNLGTRNRGLKASLQYKRSFFVDWRVCDRLKQQILGRWDYLLDTTLPRDPKLVTGECLRQSLEAAARQPFRVVPFFDPAPWGGQWMREVCGLDPEPANFGWCFDCVPEENSLRLRFGEISIEIPALNLIFHSPKQILGAAVYDRFGPEFPIRFDLLDTMSGGNLSLQVHPPADYARESFGLAYTQDESYYLLDAGPAAAVYLGLRPEISADDLFDALEGAQARDEPFPAEEFVSRWPAKKHDHFLIPAGTIHCSGAESMVLEISATPYIFTFKLWDWGRLGLDGAPRPINLRRGRNSLVESRDTDWARAELVNQIEPLGSGPGWREERTGLHPLEFIETRRHWFTGPVPHDTQGTLNVLNLVEGAEASVESPQSSFPPFIVHYAETFIVPAAVGPYTIRPHGAAMGTECATLKAFVRTDS